MNDGRRVGWWWWKDWNVSCSYQLWMKQKILCKYRRLFPINYIDVGLFRLGIRRASWCVRSYTIDIYLYKVIHFETKTSSWWWSIWMTMWLVFAHYARKTHACTDTRAQKRAPWQPWIQTISYQSQFNQINIVMEKTEPLLEPSQWIVDIMLFSTGSSHSPSLSLVSYILSMYAHSR